ncbi:hypothetical protein SAMN04488072_104123 [Lentibacillus halodurans]|uniref:YhfM-like domain-containing protein n=1 Tax=Lentibacillus halodurans TaxID=237679 RepID=A0A1I0X350_9BACI|nr:hypothetical protein [Lentibacillus halodurans]SFA95442.1 hypothetical protein SAMN04488072_104123 [Lentibacillus halodurans]
MIGIEVIRKAFLFLLLSFCTLTLIGCQAQHNEEMTLLDHVSSISISESEGYGGLNENFFISFREAETITALESILQHAKGTNADMTKEKPDYDIMIRYENGETHGLHLMLGDEGEESVFMYVGHEKDGYVVPPKDTNALRGMIAVP